MEPGNANVIAGLLRCLYQFTKINDAKELLDL